MAKLKKDLKDTTPRAYEVLSPLRVGDDKYEEGDTLDMDASEAAELVAAGVLAAIYSDPT